MLQLDEVKSESQKHHNHQKEQDPVDLAEHDETSIPCSFVLPLKKVGESLHSSTDGLIQDACFWKSFNSLLRHRLEPPIDDGL